MNLIKVCDIFPIENLEEYKTHFATWNQEVEPLDVFSRSKDEWQGWNEYKGQRNDFNRKYIFSMINFYPETNTWLFGGVYEVLSEHEDKYQVTLTDIGQEFVGRLKLSYELKGRNRRTKLEGCYHDFVVKEILPEEYEVRSFKGFENINLSFSELEVILEKQHPAWKAPLENIKGVYLITDESNGKKYVGSAYGEYGVWSRWGCYIKTGHGWNDKLKELVENKGLSYVRHNFKFTLLEYRPAITDDQTIIDRETFWKNALLTRGEFGYNLN